MGRVEHLGEETNAYIILVRWYEGKVSRGRPKCRWEDNVKTDCKEMGWEGVD